MSREDFAVLASRTLAVLLMVTALADVSYLPGSVHAFLHYTSVELSSPSATQYYRHANLIALSFLVTRIIGFSLLSRWLFKGGSEVVELLLPTALQKSPVSVGLPQQRNSDIQ
jgi:ABC-type anion transport system duplicated permease subunit